jgi:hypothetical protein
MENNFVTQGGLIISKAGVGSNADKLLLRDSSGLVKTMDYNFYTQPEIQNFFSGSTGIAGYNRANWDTAYSWGDHAGLYSPLGHTHNYENPLTFSATGAATVSRSGNTITIGATNTTYSNMSLSELTTGTATTGRVISASTLQSWGDDRYLTSLPTHTHPEYLPVGGQDNEVKVINILSSDLPANYTKDDVVAHLNTLGLSKADIDTIVVNIDGDDTLTVDWGNISGKPATYPPSSHTHPEYSSTGHTHSGVYEPVFTKNTAFNKNFGTAVGTVAQGNDSRINNGQTAYSWGNHASAGYEPAFTKNPAFNSFFGTQSGYVAEGDDSRILNGQTAYEWGNHASAGYITSSGNAATASKVTNSIAGTGSIDLVSGSMADNDHFRIRVGGTASNAGFVEIATADDGTEPIYVRQYNGLFSTLTRTATLLDASGNTSFPGTITASGGNSGNWNTAYGWGNHASAGYASSSHNHSGVYEPVFTKNTGFNKNFGTVAGTVSEGNHTHDYDKYTHWGMGVGDGTYFNVPAMGVANWVGTGGITVTRTSNEITIDGSSISSSGDLVGTLYTQSSGAPSVGVSTPIWNISPTYTNYGIFYQNETIDEIQFKGNGTTSTTIGLGSGGGISTIGTISAAGGSLTGNLDMNSNNITEISYLEGQGGNIIRSTDEWLRLNDGGTHTSGIYCGTSTIRTDGELQVGSSGSTFKASSSTLSYKNEAIPTSKGTGINSVNGFWQGTQAEYDAIGTKDANTIYFIK